MCQYHKYFSVNAKLKKSLCKNRFARKKTTRANYKKITNIHHRKNKIKLALCNEMLWPRRVPVFQRRTHTGLEASAGFSSPTLSRTNLRSAVVGGTPPLKPGVLPVKRNKRTK